MSVRTVVHVRLYVYLAVYNVCMGQYVCWHVYNVFFLTFVNISFYSGTDI